MMLANFIASEPPQMPKVGDRVRWISKVTHPNMYGATATVISAAGRSITVIVDPPWSGQIGGAWGANYGRWWEFMETTNEWGEIAP
jgi:hypothetical protein